MLFETQYSLFSLNCKGHKAKNFFKSCYLFFLLNLTSPNFTSWPAIHQRQCRPANKTKLPPISPAATPELVSHSPISCPAGPLHHHWSPLSFLQWGAQCHKISSSRASRQGSLDTSKKNITAAKTMYHIPSASNGAARCPYRSDEQPAGSDYHWHGAFASSANL